MLVLMTRKSTVTGLLLSCTAVAQGPFTPAPAILQISRELIKPGRSAAVAQIEKSGIARAVELNNPHPWLMLASLSGPDNDHWYLNGYDSYAAFDAAAAQIAAIPELAALWEDLPRQKADLVVDPRTVLARYRQDLSYSNGLSGAHTRFFLVSTVHVRPGHIAEFTELRRIVRRGHQQARAADILSVYEVESGTADGTFLVFSPSASLDEAGALSQFHGRGLENALSDQDRTRLRDLSISAIDSSETVLFRVDPSLSYPLREWIEPDPEFWRENLAFNRR